MHLAEHYNGPVEAVVFAGGTLGKAGGRTANGVIARSALFDVSAIVDSTTAGQTVENVLDSELSDGVPIVATVGAALNEANNAGALVLGVTPVGSGLPTDRVPQVHTTIEADCSIISGLHDFLSDGPEWHKRTANASVSLIDIRKPLEKELRVADGRVDDCGADIVLTTGTDYAVDKRATTFEVYRAACEGGLDARWVATGQAGMMISADAGVVIGGVPADFVAGIVEDLVSKVAETHDIVFVKGQAAPSHRAYSGVTLSLLHKSNPDVVIVADDLDGIKHGDFGRFEIGGLQEEIEIVGHLSEAEVAAISAWGDAAKVEDTVGIPTGNVLEDGGPEVILHGVQGTL